MSEPLVFLVNLSAGNGAGAEAWPKIEQLLRDAGVDYEAEATSHAEEGIALARACALRAARAVIAVGGNGTVHSIVNGLMQAAQAGGGYLPLGVIGVGKHNDFAQALGLPIQKPIAATRHLLASTAQRVDVGVARSRDLPMGERYFANGLGIGLETVLMQQGAGTLTLLHTLQRYRAPIVTITMQGVTRSQPLTGLTVGNGTHHGPLWLTPDAILDDGQLDLCVVREMGRPHLATFVVQAQRGRHASHVAVTLERTRHLAVRADSPLPLHLDGAFLPPDVRALDIEVLPGQLLVLR